MNNSAIDSYITHYAKTEDKDEIVLRLAVIDRLIELYKDRTLVSTEKFCDDFETLYNTLKHGSRQNLD